MDGQPGPEDGEGTGPDRDPGPPSPGAGGPGGPGGAPGPRRDPPGPGPRRDPRLAGFARDDARGAPAPSGPLALLVDELSGPGRRCPGADDDELAGLLQAWAAVESWASAAKLGVIREMMRRDGPPSPGSDHGDLPETWSASLRYELAGALACSTQSAESAAYLAWELQARLPGIGARLQDGTLTQPKAKAITETLEQLMDADAAAAEAMITDQLAGKTYAQVLRLAEQAALTVDPALAERRREHAQKQARVSFFREQAGTAAISGRDLPPDEALVAMASVNARAEEYKESGAFGDTPMDALRARAYLDLINGLPAAERIAIAETQDDAADPAESLARAEAHAQARAAARAAAEARSAAEREDRKRSTARSRQRPRSRSRSRPRQRQRPRRRQRRRRPRQQRRRQQRRRRRQRRRRAGSGQPGPRPGRRPAGRCCPEPSGSPRRSAASRPTRMPARAPIATAAAWSVTTTWTPTTAMTTTNPIAAMTPTAAAAPIPAGRWSRRPRSPARGAPGGAGPAAAPG